MNTNPQSEALQYQPPTGRATALSPAAADRGSARATKVPARDAQRLEQLGDAVVRRAAQGGIGLEFLGVDRLFQRPRLYDAERSPWVLCPAVADPMVESGLPIPASQRQTLRRLVEIGMDFPHIYLAHELPQTGRGGVAPTDPNSYRTVAPDALSEMLLRPPAPARTQQVADGLDRFARGAGNAVRVAGLGAAIAVAAPFALVAAGLDPAIVGAVTLPDGGNGPGAPAAWFLLAHWDW